MDPARAAPLQIFSARQVLALKLGVLALLLVAPALVGWSVWRESAYQLLSEPVAQPIPFSHKHHVGDDGIDRRYCHTAVETGRHAGLPSTHICLSCHSQLYTQATALCTWLLLVALSGVDYATRPHEPAAFQRALQLPSFGPQEVQR